MAKKKTWHDIEPWFSRSDRRYGTVYVVRCRCGFEVQALELADALADATEHVAPGMGDFERDWASN